MDLITTIRKPIQEDMQLFEKMVDDTFNNDSQILSGIKEYVLQKNALFFRPMLLLLSAKMCGTINQTTLEGALALDLLHTAQLIHEDVIDVNLESDDSISMNSRWTNKIATLSGDYILSKSLSTAIKTNNLDILRAVSAIGMQLSDAELLLLDPTKSLISSTDEYLSFAHKKTASLFASCAEVGGISVGADSLTLGHLSRFGEYVGVCYQLKCDIAQGWINCNYKILNDKELLNQFNQKAVAELNYFVDSEAKKALLCCLEYATLITP